jgi:sugar phosphate isomerase/epimerase
MQSASLLQRLAVCSWSLQPQNAGQLVERLEAVGVRRVQLALDPLHLTPAAWERTADLLAGKKIEIVSGMFGTLGEDYTTLETIKRTGGLVPDEHWDQNWRNIQTVATLARQFHLKLVTFHAGFLPHEESDPLFRKLMDRIARVADLFAAHQIDLGFETGQETAGTLAAFLSKLNRPNVGVNFDPANMILYDKGDPIAALRVLGPWLKQCHIKDATRAPQPGAWGAEVPAGTGEVNWPAFFTTLQELGYAGNLCIEREAGTQRAADIITARQLVEKLAP